MQEGTALAGGRLTASLLGILLALGLAPQFIEMDCTFY